MEAMVFLFSLLDCWALIFLWVYFIVTLSDLECEYIDASSCCSKLNKWVIPELVGHTLVTAPMLIHCTGSSPFSTYLLPPGIYIGILWCQVVTWEYLIQQKYTIEGSWSHTWKKPWSNLVSTCCSFMYLYSMILALINDWSWSSRGWRQPTLQCMVEESETT